MLARLSTSITLALISTALLAAPAYAAGKKDKEALKLHDQAMDEDYLSVEFEKAEAKLKKASEACGESNCSPEVAGKVFIALGTVHGVGQNKMDLALEDFKAALKANPEAKLIEGLTTPELEEAFKKAKGGGGEEPVTPIPTGDEEPTTAGDFPHEPVAEQAINTPIPVYVKIPDDLGATKVVVRYKPFGGEKWKSVNLERTGAGFGGYIPCADVTTTGEVRYHVIATDDAGSPVGTAGSTKQPFKVQIKQKLSNESPSLPGEDAPKKCVSKEDCPPGLPGCAPAGGGAAGTGDKGWGASCEQPSECSGGLTCLNGTCEEGGKPGGGDDRPSSKVAKNLVTLGVQFDLLLLSTSNGVCSPENGDKYACYESGTSNQFYGLPKTVAETNGVKGGITFADVRILAGYERFLFNDLGLTIGAKVGVAIGGSPSPENEPPQCKEALAGEACTQDPELLNYQPAGKASGFLPLHLEARVAYHFLAKGGYVKGGIYPFAFLGGGIAQVNASVPVTVCDEATGESGACPDQKELDAYQLSGLGFIGFGGGASYMFLDNIGAQAELKMMIMVPTTGLVVAPSIGPLLAF